MITASIIIGQLHVTRGSPIPDLPPLTTWRPRGYVVCMLSTLPERESHLSKDVHFKFVQL